MHIKIKDKNNNILKSLKFDKNNTNIDINREDIVDFHILMISILKNYVLRTTNDDIEDDGIELCIKIESKSIYFDKLFEKFILLSCIKTIINNNIDNFCINGLNNIRLHFQFEKSSMLMEYEEFNNIIDLINLIELYFNKTLHICYNTKYYGYKIYNKNENLSDNHYRRGVYHILISDEHEHNFEIINEYTNHYEIFETKLLKYYCYHLKFLRDKMKNIKSAKY